MEYDNKPLGIAAEGHNGWHDMQRQISALREMGYRRDSDPELIQEARELIIESRQSQDGRVQFSEVIDEQTIVHLLDGEVEVVEGKHTLFEAAELLRRKAVTHRVSISRKRRG